MCGICGIVRLEDGAPVGLAPLEAMRGALAHRGPDGEGLWSAGRVGFAHRRLRVLDLSGAGSQPMTSVAGQACVIYNGEIYNYRELRNELVAAGAAFRSECDTEVLLEACRVWGDAALARFNGMFAFARYDAARGRLLLARDRLGIKPLFFTIRGGTLAFASELDALRRGGFAGGPPHPAAVDAFLTYLYIPEPDTIYPGVHKLMPGEQLVVEGLNGDSPCRVSRSEYWKLHYGLDSRWTLDTAAERYRELLDDAVRLCRVSDVPLGAFLSGGVDSSSVTALLSAQSSTPVRTFTIGFDDAQADELAYARLAAERFATNHTEAIVRPDMAALLPELSRLFGEPFADSSALPMWLVSKVARESVTVALSGDGGDELLAGYSWTHMDRRVAAYRRVPVALRHAGGAALALLPDSPLAARLRRFQTDSFLSPRESFRRRLSCFDACARAALYQPEFAEQIQAIDRFAGHYDAAVALSEADRLLYTDTRMYLPGDILTKVDRMSMAHGLEARVPLLDHRLVEFAATVPFPLKYGRGISKRLAKHAMRGLLPPELLRQRKRGFSVPIQRWFREELREVFSDTVLSPGARCRAYFRTAPIQQRFDAHRARSENHGHALWALLCFETWLRYAGL